MQLPLSVAVTPPLSPALHACCAANATSGATLEALACSPRPGPGPPVDPSDAQSRRPARHRSPPRPGDTTAVRGWRWVSPRGVPGAPRRGYRAHVVNMTRTYDSLRAVSPGLHRSRWDSNAASTAAHRFSFEVGGERRRPVTQRAARRRRRQVCTTYLRWDTR